MDYAKKIQTLPFPERFDPVGDMVESLIMYTAYGLPTGGFLESYLSNDLMTAVERADGNNTRHFCLIAKFMFNHMPSGSWGSPEAYTQWIKSRGLSRDYADLHLYGVMKRLLEVRE